MNTATLTPNVASTLALQALAWSLIEPARAARLLTLTGLAAEDLRARADDPAVLAAVIAFLASHEPDLIACATAIGVAPATLAAAGPALAQ